MKHSIPCMLALSAAAAFVIAPSVSAGTFKRASSPIVIPHPPIPNGSNWSRAPFPAERPQNDATPPNAMAFDLDLPPNTPATTPEPFAPPPAAFAILQPARPTVDPGTLPTGLPTVGASVALDAARVEPSIRNAMFEGRDDLVDGLRVRLRQSELALTGFERSRADMSASGRSQFDTLFAEARAREKALDRSIRTASRASIDTWESARAQLVADYNAYAAALAQLDAAVGIAPAPRY